MGREQCIFIVGIMMTMSLTASDQYANKLTKVYHHHGKLTDKVVCYFADAPIWNQIPHRPSADGEQQQMVTTTYFLPKVNITSKETQHVIALLNRAKNPDYHMEINAVTRPMTGVEISVTYDAAKVAFACEQFDAISQQKGLVFSFHHKDVLNQIHRKTDTIMNYAHNKHAQKPKVMLDFGHGGRDNGKVGYCGIKEKDITLQVGTKVASLLQQQGYHVEYTRTSDIFIPLDERTTRTNTLQADIFVSIHANGAANERAEGIETFWMNPTLLRQQTALSDAVVDTIMKSIKQQQFTTHKLLASSVHEHVVKHARKHYPAKDRTVKESVSQVLLGTDYSIPTTLIEIGFLSNEHEAKLLATSSYQDTIARGICDGIHAYFTAMNKA